MLKNLRTDFFSCLSHYPPFFSCLSHYPPFFSCLSHYPLFFSCLSHYPPFFSRQVLVGVASRKTCWILCIFARPSISLKLRPTGIKLLLWMNINVEDLQTELWTVFLTQWQTRKLHSLDLLSRKTQGTQGIIYSGQTNYCRIKQFLSVFSSYWLKKLGHATRSVVRKILALLSTNLKYLSCFQAFSRALRRYCVFSWN